MSILNTLLWWQWLIISAIPFAIVLLYFLKLKRLPQEVPSTFLWSRTIEDLHVNTIWQRLRRNLLLLLQILIVLFLIVSLLRPGWQGMELTDERFIFLLDNSASMSALDEQPTRLAEAKRQAQEIIGQMKDGHSAMVIAFSDQAQVVQPYTQSRRALRRQVESIETTTRPTNLRDALSAASGLANPGLTRLENEQVVDEALPATIYIFSDGGFDAVTEFSLGNLAPQFVTIGKEDVSNVGIVAFSTDRNPEAPERMQAFCSVANYDDQDTTIEIELFIDDESMDVVELTVKAGQEKGWHFDLPDLDEAVLKLVVNHEDALSVDNIAYSAVNRPRFAKVLVVTPGDETLRLALKTEKIQELAIVSMESPAILDDEEHLTAADTGVYDLIVYDRCQPKQPPQANTLFIGALPPGDKWAWGKKDGPPTIIDIDRIHPLAQLIDMNYVRIAEGHKLTPPAGSTVLFDSAIGPIFAIGPREGYEDAVLGFPLLTTDAGEITPNTTWPLRPSFPVFVYNVVRYLGGSRGSSGVTNVRPGQPITLRSHGGASQLTVIAPNGSESALRRDGYNSFVFTDTEELGVYTVRHEGLDFSQRFVVNLFDAQESNIKPRAEMELGHETITGTPGVQASRREMWKWLLALAFLLLGLEWYIYNRRIYL